MTTSKLDRTATVRVGCTTDGLAAERADDADDVRIQLVSPASTFHVDERALEALAPEPAEVSRW